MELQWINGKVVGFLENGVFTQHIQSRHIFRKWNAKGMDLGLYRSLRSKCNVWRLVIDDTHQVLTIPFKRVGISGFEADTNGSGRQMMVKLNFFDEERPAAQKRMM